MTDQITYSFYSSRGTILYTPPCPIAKQSQANRLPTPPCRPRQRRPHSIHITRLPAGFVPYDLRPQPPPPPPKTLSRFSVELRKLASRENAKRVLGTVLSPFSTNNTTSTTSANDTRSGSPETNRSSLRTSFSAASADPSSLYSRRLASGALTDDNAMTSRPELDGRIGESDVGSDLVVPTKRPEPEKPIASGNGVACYIQLAEPVVFLSGLDHDGTRQNSHTNSTAILRGKLRLEVTKSAKIKAVTLRFTGRARTEWPEGKVKCYPIFIHILIRYRYTSRKGAEP
jgi:hypothetical protein